MQLFWAITGVTTCTEFSFKREANDLVFSVKSRLVLKKSDWRTTYKTGMTTSCFIMRKRSHSHKFTTSVCPFRLK